MKAKVRRGSGFRGALNYTFGNDSGDKKSELIGGTLSGQNAQECAAEFAVTRHLRPDIEKPVWHCSLALPSGERLSPEVWRKIAADFMKKMGFREVVTQYVVNRHGDTDHDHIHILASRIGLDGSVWHGEWEARRAIEATQQLEAEYGLTLTPGLSDVRAEQKQMTAAEINRAVRTRQEPVRQQLQRLVAAAAKGNPTAAKFAERLVAAGVSVRANIARTGKMNGFSFEIENIAFKGSDLGKAFTWNGLLKMGVTYDETGHNEKLIRLSGSPRNSTANDIDTGGTGEITTSGGGGSGERDTAYCPNRSPFDEVGSGGRQASGFSAELAGSPDRRNDQTIHEQAGGKNKVARNDVANASRVGHEEPKVHRGDHAAATRQDQRAEANHRGRELSENGPVHSGGLPAAEHSIAMATELSTMENGTSSSGGSRSTLANREKVGSGSPARPSWNERFKKAARKRSVAGALQIAESGGTAIHGPIDYRTIENAREIDPTSFLEGFGYRVQKDGQRHLSVRINGDEYFRITQKPDGHYVACDVVGNGVGDNIALYQEVAGCDFAEAIFALTNSQISALRSEPFALKPDKAPRVPKEAAEIAADSRLRGRRYLSLRGISDSTIEAAEKGGFLQYLVDGVLFVGRDIIGAIRCVTKRAIARDAVVQKRDFSGSDKSFPPIFKGGKTVWIVEGGADALAAHDIAKITGEELPTVIVSGGAYVRGFLGQKHVQDILKAAEKIVVVRDRESNPEKQLATDTAHAKQVELIVCLCGVQKVAHWIPPEGKDLAEYQIVLRDHITESARETCYLPVL